MRFLKIYNGRSDSDLFKFIQDVMPLMSEIQGSFQDTSGKLPDATQRLNDVTHATEMATNEIMDKLESINIREEGILIDLNLFRILFVLLSEIIFISFISYIIDFLYKKFRILSEILHPFPNL
jgi:hypothetical protein